MSQDYSSTRIADEIDSIIARAMAEYSAAKGVDVWDTSTETTNTSSPPEEEVPEVIPQNSGSILVEETTSRFSGATWYYNIRTKRITLAGLGGIGSYVAFLLARMHPDTIILYDDDYVESANISGQLYETDDVGQLKVSATAEHMRTYSDYYASTANERFTNSTELCTEIAICGFDNMEARRTFYNAWKRQVQEAPADLRKKYLFIDGRLAAESFQILCIRGDDEFSMQRYADKFLFTDAEADKTICSYKQTSFMANMIASVMVNLFVNFCANECDPLVPRDLPFYTEYTAETMFFKVIT